MWGLLGSGKGILSSFPGNGFHLLANDPVVTGLRLRYVLIFELTPEPWQF